MKLLKYTTTIPDRLRKTTAYYYNMQIRFVSLLRSSYPKIRPTFVQGQIDDASIFGFKTNWRAVIKHLQFVWGKSTENNERVERKSQWMRADAMCWHVCVVGRQKRRRQRSLDYSNRSKNNFFNCKWNLLKEAFFSFYVQ